MLTLVLMPVGAFALGCDGAGNCYIYAGATGTGTGASWTNAYTGFGTGAHQVNPASMTRGVTYWIAAGSYGGVIWSTPDSGTSVITIEGATTSSHGPDGTWSNSYAGVAAFGESAITTDYWTINGQSWLGNCSGQMSCGVDAAYTIYFLNASDGSGQILRVGPGTNYTIEYVDMQGTGTPSNWATQSGNSDDGFTTYTTGTGLINNVYVGYSYLHDVGEDLVSSNRQGTGGYNGTNHVWEHNFLARNFHGSTGLHTQAMSECATTLTVRYNTFFDVVQDGVIDINTGGPCTITTWYVYGNEVKWDNNVPTVRQALADGFIGMFGQVMSSSSTINVYNNTFANITCPASTCGVNLTLVFDCAQTGNPSGCDSTENGTINIYNNLLYNNGFTGNLAGNFGCDDGPCNAVNDDYNVGYCPSGGCANGGGYGPAGAHDQQISSTNPFSNFNGTTNLSVALAADTPAGLSITGWTTTPSGCTSGTNCLNADALGVTRGANGTIDRGALQIPGGSTFTLSTATAGAGTGTVTGCAGNYSPGASYSCTVTPGTGSSITSVTGCGGSGTTTYAGSMPSSNCTVTATFSLNTYTLSTTTAGAGSGTVSGCAGSHNFGVAYTCTVTPGMGSAITGVSGCGGGGTTSYAGTMPASNCTVTATFGLSSFTLTTATTGSGAGTITGCGGSMAFGQSFACTVTPTIGSILQSVSGCGGTGSSSFSGSMPAGDCTVTASFGMAGPVIPNAYTVSGATVQ